MNTTGALLVFVHLITLASCGTSRFKVEIVTMGFIPPSSYASLAYTGAGFQTGIEQLREDYRGIFNVSHVLLYDSNVKDCLGLSTVCDDLAGRYFYQRQITPNMTVFMVPGCIDSPLTNRLVREWNVLYITSVYADAVIRKKAQSPTWISTTPLSGTNYVLLYIALLQQYNWTTVFFISDKAAVPFFGEALTNSVFASFQSQKGNQGTLRNVNTDQNNNFTAVLADFRRISRICVFFGHAKHLRILLKQAALAGMTNGEYIYIGLDNFLNTKFGNFMWRDYNVTADAESVPPGALTSLLLISLVETGTSRKLSAKLAASLENKWRMTARERFNYSAPAREKITPYTFASHAAMEIFGQVLNETLARYPEFDPSDGQTFARAFFSRRFQTSVSDVYIDDVGEPRTQLVLQQFYSNSTALVTVAVQLPNNGTLVQVAGIQWPDGYGPPLNKPQCGYGYGDQEGDCIIRGNRTSLAGYSIAGFCGLLLVLVALCAHFSKKTVAKSWWKVDNCHLQLKGEVILQY